MAAEVYNDYVEAVKKRNHSTGASADMATAAGHFLLGCQSRKNRCDSNNEKFTKFDPDRDKCFPNNPRQLPNLTLTKALVVAISIAILHQSILTKLRHKCSEGDLQ